MLLEGILKPAMVGGVVSGTVRYTCVETGFDTFSAASLAKA